MLTIPHIQNDYEFITAALSVFRYQYENNKVYHRFCNLLHRSPHNVHTLEDIPFLPIHFFKTEKVYCGDTPHQEIFTSSGTTGAQTSQHYVKDLSIYQESFRKGFQHFYGDVRNYTILALLPSYLERQGYHKVKRAVSTCTTTTNWRLPYSVWIRQGGKFCL